MEDGKLNLAVKIAGDDYDDFFPYELTLEEGFSGVYHAQLTVFTKTRRDQTQMEELLERGISVTVSQRTLKTGSLRRRFLHGIISGVESAGIASRSSTNESFCYKLTIESPIARLRHTHLNCPYYGKSPPDIIQEILSRYEVIGEFSGDYIKSSEYSKNTMFDQVNCSDLDFMHHVMDLYGISWTFVHAKSAEGSLGTTQLYFSEGSRFPAPCYEYSDKRKIPEIEHFGFINYDDEANTWKMDSWVMDSNIGVEGVEITAPYPQANYGSKEWKWGTTEKGKRYHSYNFLFHDYKRGTDTGEIDSDIKRMMEAERIALLTKNKNWNGSAQNIALMPGLIFELKHFWGVNDTSVITALVTDSRLHIRTPWPRDFEVPPVMAGMLSSQPPEELALVEFKAADWGKDSEKRFCRRGHL